MSPEMKSPRSPLQIAAARANGAKSRGPITAAGKRASAANSANSTGAVTPEGKARSSQNATRHGLLSDSMVLHGESDARFCALINTLESELQPEPGIESIQTEIMAVAHWRRMRLWSLEKALYLQETLKRQDAAACNSANSAQAGNGDGINEDGDDGETPITHLAHSFRSLADQSHALELLNRYETRYGREYLRALGCFNNQRDRKTAARKAKGRDRTEPSRVA
jgi:hypothetical protein